GQAGVDAVLVRVAGGVGHGDAGRGRVRRRARARGRRRGVDEGGAVGRGRRAVEHTGGLLSVGEEVLRAVDGGAEAEAVVDPGTAVGGDLDDGASFPTRRSSDLGQAGVDAVLVRVAGGVGHGDAGRGRVRRRARARGRRRGVDEGGAVGRGR